MPSPRCWVWPKPSCGAGCGLDLAGRSAKAARETSDLIEGATTRVQAGVKIADETSKSFAVIVNDIEEFTFRLKAKLPVKFDTQIVEFDFRFL